MKKFTISCIALAMVMGACLTAEAQNNRNRFKGQREKKEEVYDITFKVQKFRGYKWINKGPFDTSAKPLNYSVNYVVSGDGQRVAGADKINNVVRMQYYNVNGGTKTISGLSPDARLNFSSSGSLGDAKLTGPPLQVKSINPRGETVWLNGVDYQVAITYTVTKREVR